jgi:hypothetical protein
MTALRPAPTVPSHNNKEASMAIGNIIEDHRSSEQAEQIAAHVRSSGPNPPDGARLLLGGPTSEGWRVVTVWDSAEERDRFYSERLRHAYDAAGLSFDDVVVTQFEVEWLVAADLMGAVS